MRIFLYVPGMPFDGALIHTLSLGGSESAGYGLARALADLGHEVAVFCNTPQGGHWDGVAYHPLGAATPQTPFGENFERLARVIPHDVLIAQRMPGIFARPYPSQVNLWWSHDLATVRSRDAVKAGFWNCQGVLAVSAFHQRQMVEVLGLPPEFVHVVPNAIDGSLFAGAESDTLAQAKWQGKTLVYTSRPERGLEHLVRPGGIMERLWERERSINLLVAGYDNTTPALAPLYQALQQRCEALPNVQALGAFNKRQVAEVFQHAWLHVYPVVRPETFEEVSCISAMEAQAGGTPVVTSANGALPETLAGGGALLLPYGPAGDPDPEAFAQAILELAQDQPRWLALRQQALAKARQYDWRTSAEAVITLVQGILRRGVQRPPRLARHLLHTGDVLACRALADQADIGPRATQELALVPARAPAPGPCREQAVRPEAPAAEPSLAGVEAAAGLPRLGEVRPFLRRLASDARVLDYGCGAGDLTLALAREFPHLRFLGVDAEPAQVERAAQTAQAVGAGNVEFQVASGPGAVPPAGLGAPYDLVLALEVLRHQADPAACAQALEALCHRDGRVVLTLPQGAPESIRADVRPGRKPLSHLDHHDVRRMWGAKPGFAFTHFGWGGSEVGGEPVSGTLVTWQPGGAPVTAPDYAGKFTRILPREQVSACLIVHWSADCLERTLKSLAGVVDELIVGVDDEGGPEGGDANPTPGQGPVWDLCRRYGADRLFALSASPLVQGFDAARNETLALATGEWVLWLDADEELHHGQRLWKYLRPNAFEAYALPQHHLGTEPPGLIKTDLPCRLFRNGVGLRFFGVVHEHPCFAPERPPRHAMLIPEVVIGHHGYSTEQVRRKRFERNLPLMIRDRERYPQRPLGKMLWVRDLMHLARFELERTGQVTPQARQQAQQATVLWRELLAAGEVRLALEALPYVSEAAALLVGPERVLQWRTCLETRLLSVGNLATPGQPPHLLQGAFAEADDVQRLVLALAQEQLKPYRERYFG